jgi:hypothetical protein
MTRAAKIKKTIRARAAKTGESYTAARLQHLAGRAPRQSARGMPPETGSLGAVSDAKCRERTGRSLADWYRVLDAYGAATKGHTASARHLREEHGVSAWYSQGITVAYERARGLRAVNQRSDGSFAISVSRTLAADVSRAVAAIQREGLRSRWLPAVDPALRRALVAGLRAGRFRYRRDRSAHLTYPWGKTGVEISLEPRPGGRSRVSVTSRRLPGSGVVAERRVAWRTALDALKRHLAD